jgi:(1->4)-alpha-D-glucan 1-alpha-D-glucosylmutase
VYRSYLPAGREHLEQALAAARRRRPDLADALDDVGGRLGDPDGPTALRFQQTSGMVMAKGVEDCAFYRWSRLTSLNEVGADPSVFSLSPSELHAAMAARQDEWPHALTALSTHDTKRSEDTRARITALAEDPVAWADGLDALLAAAPLPDPAFGNLLWQAALGAWPVSRERLHAYAEKAMREAGEHTSWTDPDEQHESAVHAAIDRVYDDPAATAVLEGLVERFAAAGESNSLALKLLATTVPGVPDVYQGSEAEERSLVDPDNRRPVDFDALAATLAEGSHAKQRVTATALRLRRDRPELFTGYAALVADGAAAGHALAFDRGGAVTVVTRLPFGLARDGWGDTTLELPEGRWTDALSGRAVTGRVALEELLSDLPVALLVREDV